MTKLLAILGLSVILACSAGGKSPENPNPSPRAESAQEEGVEPSTYNIVGGDRNLLWSVMEAAMGKYQPVESDKNGGYIESKLFGWRKTDGKEDFATIVVRMREIEGGMRLGVWAYAMQPIGTRSADGSKDEWEIVGAHRKLQQDTARQIFEAYLMRAAAEGKPLPNEETLEIKR